MTQGDKMGTVMVVGEGTSEKETWADLKYFRRMDKIY